MAYYAAAPLLCALVVSISVTSALAAEDNVKITLYVDKAVSEGANRTAVTSVDTRGFGSIYMSDRSVADGSGANANRAGRALGVYFKSSAAPANIWTVSITLVFEDKSRFSGSTLQVSGIDLGKECDWSIVGGTGKFTLARGVVHRKFITVPGSPVHEELKINAYYSSIAPMSVSF